LATPFTIPSITDFKTYFFRDFPFGTVQATSVLDGDITNAFADVAFNFNPNFFPDQPSYTLGFLLLAAHYLVMNLRSSSQGWSGQFSWLQTAKSAGSVSDATSIPQRILDNPLYAYLTKTNYGTKFLMLILPQLSGQMFVLAGGTQA
jgi:hypothetical protein